jgi:hypothetical protein
MKAQPLTNKGGDARDNQNFSGHNQMKDYIVGHRHDFNELGARWNTETTATSQTDWQLPAN